MTPSIASSFNAATWRLLTATNLFIQRIGGGIIEVVDEILSHDDKAAGLAIHWQLFGSNGHEKADYSKGVLERFTRRAPKGLIVKFSNHTCGNTHVKTIYNPRKINFVPNPHFAVYFEGFYSVNENGTVIQGHGSESVVAEKIVLNHYYTKSLEEFHIKQNRGRSDIPSKYKDFWYDAYNRNDEFDDRILKYRAARAEKFFFESDVDRFNRVTSALTKNLSAYASGEVLSLETALTCRALSTYLREKFPNDAPRWKVYEEASLAAIIKSVESTTFTNQQPLYREVNEVRLLVRELPKLLKLIYPVVKELRIACLEIIPLLMEVMHQSFMFNHYVEINYIYELLKLGG